MLNGSHKHAIFDYHHHPHAETQELHWHRPRTSENPANRHGRWPSGSFLCEWPLWRLSSDTLANLCANPPESIPHICPHSLAQAHVRLHEASVVQRLRGRMGLRQLGSAVSPTRAIPNPHGQDGMIYEHLRTHCKHPMLLDWRPTARCDPRSLALPMHRSQWATCQCIFCKKLFF